MRDENRQAGHDRAVRRAREAPRDTASFAEAQLREQQAKAALREIDLVEKRAKVVPVEDARAVLGELAVAVRARFAGVGRQVAERIAGESSALVIQCALEVEIDAGLLELAAFTPERTDAI